MKEKRSKIGGISSNLNRKTEISLSGSQVRALVFALAFCVFVGIIVWLL